MIRRLVEAHYTEHRSDPTDERVAFWLLESRTPSMLVDVVADHTEQALETVKSRLLLNEAFAKNISALEKEMLIEQRAERQADKDYWDPLKRELEALRRQVRKERG